jgi:ankyrin repeat protein
MLAHGADINAHDRNGGTPLHEAVRQGNVELVRALVSRGADLHARTEQGAEGGNLPVRRRSGLTPFLAAAQTGNVEMMRVLMALGADPAALTPDGAGAVLIAAGSRRLEAVQMVVELGLDVNRYPDARPSALHTAVRFGSDDIVEYLAAHGADFEARDNFGRTPLEEAEFEAPSHTIDLVRRLSAERQRGPTQ